MPPSWPCRAAAGPLLATLPSSAAPPPWRRAGTSPARPGLGNAYRVLDSDGRPRPDFRWESPGDRRDPVGVLRDEGVRFDAGGAADPAQRITAAELSALIEIPDEDAIRAGDQPPVALVGRQQWDWDRYAAELGVPDDRLQLGRQLVDLLTEAIAERDLPWQAVFRKGYIAVRRPGGYVTLLVDLTWRKPVRLAVKLPYHPAALSLASPYPGLEETWGDQDREWGWTLRPGDIIPDLRPAVDIAARVHPATGPTRQKQ